MRKRSVDGSTVSATPADRSRSAAAARAAPAVTEVLRPAAHMGEVHLGRIEVEIEMHVDVDVELAGKPEDAIDLPVRIRVGVRTGANHPPAPLERGDHQLLSPGIVQEPFLRENADLEI